MSIDGAFPWWSLAIFALCIYVVHGIIVSVKTNRHEPELMAAGLMRAVGPPHIACRVRR